MKKKHEHAWAGRLTKGNRRVCEVCGKAFGDRWPFAKKMRSARDRTLPLFKDQEHAPTPRRGQYSPDLDTVIPYSVEHCTKSVMVRLMPSELSALQSQAAAASRSLSSFVRYTLQEAGVLK